MSRTSTLPLLGKTHPLTGQPIRAVGFRKNGRPIFPIMGGDPSNDPPEKPEDLLQETWDALGDPGKAALVSERGARQQAEKDRDTARRERDAARARPAPPKNDPAGGGDGTGGTGGQGGGTQQGQPDIAAIVKQAVDAAVKPFAEAETQRQVQAAADKVKAVVLEAAKPLLHDPTDALANVDLASLVKDDGTADPDKVTQALAKVVENKPHLARTNTRIAPFGIGGGAPAGTASEADLVKARLTAMQQHAGVRVTPTP